tara:strand:- start:242 stop:649 length:408 start_codon:yes stop_codon:yes gene_type:complete
MNPFEHVKNLHTKQQCWDDFNDEDKKSFNVYIINKTLSFNPDYLNIVNYVQKYSAGQVTPKEVFQIYFSLLPTKFKYCKWIKGQKKTKDKEKVEHLATHFKCSTREATDYLDILDKKTIKSILRNYDTKVSRKSI